AAGCSWRGFCVGCVGKIVPGAAIGGQMPRSQSKRNSAKKSSRGLSIPNPISSARELFAIVREMSFEELHDAAQRPPRIAVVAPSVGEARQSALRLFGPEARIHVVTLADSDPWPSGAEVVLLDQRTRPPRGAVDEHLITFGPEDAPERVLREVFKAGDEIELRIGQIGRASCRERV